jgi:hypothetical protein
MSYAAKVGKENSEAQHGTMGVHRAEMVRGRARIHAADLYVARHAGNQVAARVWGGGGPTVARFSPHRVQAALPAYHRPERVLGNHDHGRATEATVQVSKPGDWTEREANQVADDVMRSPGTTLPPTGAYGGRGPRTATVAASTGGIGLQANNLSQTKFASSAGPGEPVSDTQIMLQEVLNSPGQAIERGLAFYMGERLRHDFSPVRVHTDAAAAKSARVLNARAYTVGHHLVFAQGQYSPHNPDGQRLLAHELTHVLQQSTGSFSTSGGSSRVLLQRQPGSPASVHGASHVGQASTRSQTGSAVGSQQVQVEDFVVSLSAIQIPVPAEPRLLELWVGNMPVTGGPVPTTQFAAQALFHTRSAVSDRRLMELALLDIPASQAIAQYKGAMRPTLQNIWRGAQQSTGINVTVHATFKLATGDYAKLTREQVAADLTWQVARSLVAETVAEPLKRQLTMQLAARGGALGALKGPIGAAVGFAVGAFAGACLDLLMTERLMARLSDLIGGGQTGHEAHRTAALTRARQQAVNEQLARKWPVLEQIELMESRFNRFDEARIAIGKPYKDDRAGINRGASGNQISKQVRNGIELLHMVRDKWSLRRDLYLLVHDWDAAAYEFRRVLDGPLPRAIEDALELMRGADRAAFQGPDASPWPNGHRIIVRKDTSYPLAVDPRSHLGPAQEFAETLTGYLLMVEQFCRGKQVEEPLAKQLQATYGFAW